MREKAIEHKLVKAVKAEGGMCPKLVSPGTDGMPDRMVLLPEAHIGFVEVKAPGEKPRPLQVRGSRRYGRSFGVRGRAHQRVSPYGTRVKCSTRNEVYAVTP